MIWKEILQNLFENLKRTWFLWAFIIVYALLITWAVSSLEGKSNNGSKIKNYWDALYFVLACMTTIGTCDIVPNHPLTKFITIFNGFVGIFFLGLLLWLFTKSMG